MDTSSMQLGSDGSYIDQVQEGQADNSNSNTSNVYISDQGIEYHDPGSSSRASMGVSEATPAAATFIPDRIQGSPFSRHLGRNRACASCRDRKLKCDGMRPICGQCSRAWATRKKTLKSKGASEHALQDLEQPCSYLDVQQKTERGSRSAKGVGRVRTKAKEEMVTPIMEAERERKRLEEEVAELRARLQLQETGEQGKGDMAQNYPNSDELSIAEILATTMRSGEGFPSSESRPSSIPPHDAHNLQSFVGSLTGVNGASQMAKLASASLDAANILPHPISHATTSHSTNDKVPIDPLLLDPTNGQYKLAVDLGSGSTENLSQVMFNGWPSDFPSPAMVDKLTRVFFEMGDFLRYIFQPSRFFEQLSHGPNSPRYPSHAVLHAIFAMAYALRPELDPTNQFLLGTQMDRNLASVDSNSMASSRYHCERARHHISKTTGQNSDLLSVCKAAIIMTGIHYGFGDIFEAWNCSGIATKMAVAMSLNRTKVDDEESSSHRDKVDMFWTTLIPPPTNWIEEEERRRVMFLAYIGDQAGASSLLWSSSLKESDIHSELPLYSTFEFQQETRSSMSVVVSQTLQSPKLFTEHRFDGFSMLLKSMLLVGRCGEFLSHLPFAATVEQVKVADWYRLNNLVTSFSSSQPFNRITADQVGDNCDSAPLMIKVAIHTCTLQLHEPLAKLDENSREMCRAACSGITNLLRLLAASNSDVISFSPIFAFSLGLAGRVLISLLEMAIKQNTLSQSFPSDQQSFSPAFGMFTFDPNNPNANQNNQAAGLGGATRSEMEKLLQNEIDLIFIFLCKYGRIWPLATHFAKAMAAQLGVTVASPELLRYGIFTDRNNGNHIY